MSCETCPDHLIPEDIDTESENWAAFAEELQIAAIPHIIKVGLNIEVAHPESELVSAIEHYSIDPEYAIDDITSMARDIESIPTFIKDEIDSIARVLELDGYEVHFDIIGFEEFAKGDG